MNLSNLDVKEKKVGVLLGAGASIDAGIPGVYNLTTEIYNRLKTHNGVPNAAQTFGYIIGGIVQRNALLQPQDIFSVNIEEVVSALKLISERKILEAQPFIGSWDPFIESFDKISEIDNSEILNRFEDLGEVLTKTIADSTKSLYEGLNTMFSGRSFSESDIEDAVEQHRYELNDIFRDIATELNETNKAILGSTPNHFEGLYDEVHVLLRDLMWIQDFEKCSYLSALLEFSESNSANIFTLNYDTTIECAAKELGIELKDGFEGEEEYFSGNFGTSNEVNYYKLHGSVTWHGSIGGIKKAKAPYIQREPLLIIGQREKLRSNGPFLDLLFEFYRKLEEIDYLIVIGYSFRDDHINKFLLKWLRNEKSLMQIACGPNFSFEHSPAFYEFKKKIENSGLYTKDFLK